MLVVNKVLGPLLMPNPKAGTVSPDVAKAVAEAKAGKIDTVLIRQILSTALSKAFSVEKLDENFETLIDAIVMAKLLKLLLKELISDHVLLHQLWCWFPVSTAKIGV